MSLQCYLTHTNDGLSVNPQGIMGGRITLWNPATQQFVDWHVPSAGGAYAHNCFNGVLIDGVPGQQLQDRKPYYVYMMLAQNDQSVPTFNFSLAGLPTRYGWNPDGLPLYTDAGGNIGTLVGMVCPVNGSIGNVLGAPNSRILCSSSPFLAAPQQGLSANSGQLGGTFSNTTPQPLDFGLPIIACSWAWMEASSYFMGRIADNDGDPTTFIRPFARSLVNGAMNYGPLIIVQCEGKNLPIGGTAVSRAFDDGAYEFGIEVWVSHGAAHIQIEHIVKGWI